MATQKEIEKFFKENEKKAFRKINFQLHNEEDALDVVQDAMIKLVQNYQDKPIGEMPMLFNTILHNCFVDFVRRKNFEDKNFQNFDDIDSEDSSGLIDNISFENGYFEDNLENALSSKQSIKLIEEGLKKLPARQSEAFLLRYWEDLSVEETAKIMDCSEGSVKTHCFRAIQSLKEILKNLRS